MWKFTQELSLLSQINLGSELESSDRILAAFTVLLVVDACNGLF